MLEKFEASVAGRVAHLQTLEAEGAFPPAYYGDRPSFRKALEAAEVPVIAEYKRASPSKGDINTGVSPEDVARAYAGAGAAAMSVLTEPEYFKGDLDFIDRISEEVDLPLLRKDFIAHPIQVVETAGTRASAMLAIARFDPYGALAYCLAEAKVREIEVIMEVFDVRDLDKARELGATIIQVNSRDLDTLDVNPGKHDKLITLKQPGEFWIAASGITGGARIRELTGAGYGACLIGTSLMAGGDPGGALQKMITEAS